MVELLAAPLANANNGSMPEAILVSDKRLIVPYQIQSRPLAIATMTGRYEVFRVIVVPVAIKMVNHQRTRRRFCTYQPLNGTSAMVAGVNARANLLVKDVAMFTNTPISSRKWMA